MSEKPFIVERIDPREWSEHDPELEDAIRYSQTEDKRGFWVRLAESIRAKVSTDKKGNFSAEITGGATFLTERRITEEDAWREVNRPFVAAGVVIAALCVVCGVLAFFFAR